MINNFVYHILQKLDIKIDGETKTHYKILCKFHSEKTASLFINKGNGSFKCFGCGESGSFKQFYFRVTGKQLQHEPISFKNILMKFDIKRDKDNKIPNFKLGRLNRECKQYLRNVRHLSKKIIRQSLIFYIKSKKFNNSYLCFPVLYNNQFAGCEIRLYKHSNFLKKSIKYGTLSKYLYGYDEAIKNKEYVIVVEGLFDVFRLRQFGYNAVGIFGSTLYNSQIVKLLKFHKMILMFDGDNSGYEAGKKYLTILRQYNDNVYNIKLPISLDPKDLSKKQLQKILKKYLTK